MARIFLVCLVFAFGVEFIYVDARVSSANAARTAEYLRQMNQIRSEAEASFPDRGEPPAPGSVEGDTLEPRDFEAAEQLPGLEGDGIAAGGEDPMVESGKFEGDIELRGLPIEVYVDEYYSANPNLVGDIQHNAIKGKHYRWSDNIIPFKLNKDTFPDFERAVIASAIDEYNKHTCIKWKPRTNERSYVEIIKEDGCWSNVGRAGGKQQISLGSGCVTKGIVIHEMMHAIGFFHEQSRTDRKSHVTINWQNINSEALRNFDKYSVRKIDDLGTPYDYGSIMHYGKTSFGKISKTTGRRLMTIEPTDVNAKIGQRKGLSENDIKKINLLHDCPTDSNSGSGKKPIDGREKGGEECVDSHSFCDYWAMVGHCFRTHAFMTKRCPKACNKCTKSSGTSCTNSGVHCDYWRQQGYCARWHKHHQYMMDHCKKSCNVC